MIHRHLDYPSDLPADRLPAEAIVDILDRGDLDDWGPIAKAVARDPNGSLANNVERLVNAYPMYGTSILLRAFIERLRARSEGPQMESTRLAEVRRRRGFSQVHLSKLLGISQSDLSKLERRRDMRLSTMRKYVAALGGRLRLVADFPDDHLEVEQAED
jgi:DNA-binding XRE family transcriptional regulator